GMVAVLLLFLVPVGGGIPAGVLLARAKGMAWPLTAGLYLVSDLILALAFEPVLRVLTAMARRVPWPDRFRYAWREAQARTQGTFGSSPAGPAALVLISFGIDPMTGRASALAAGHGPVAGWAFAIAGDMLYYAVVAAVTLRLNDRIRHPEATVALMLTAMVILPLLAGRVREAWRRRA
ncbi:MAG TPA: hypothetical protein VK188_13150, partial [Holophaga sp.]|nr:hypothetical protein [Holophaga sp.]